jgi:GT2 family glycosyltransferase
MISIITAIHNGLAINELFLENLKKYTYHPYELIIIDNNSTDGSREFFKSNGAVVIENDKNFSYPVCQNQGIQKAKYDIYGFLNNDIIVAPHWDKHLIDIATEHGLEAITPCGIERIESIRSSQLIRLKWKIIKNGLAVLGKNKALFKLMHRLMYGNWDLYNQRRYKEFGNSVVEGFIGNTVLMFKSLIDKVGLWDERMQAADFDLYLRMKKRNLEVGDVKPLHMALGVFNHHFIRLTVNSKPTPFHDFGNILTLEQKWGKENLEKLLVDNAW